MKIIKVIAGKIKEEVKDAETYADLAMEWTKEDPDTAELFEELSEEEMMHADKLHKRVEKLIEKYRAEKGEPDPRMMGRYEYMHEEQIENARNARIKQNMYKAEK